MLIRRREWVAAGLCLTMGAMLVMSAQAEPMPRMAAGKSLQQRLLEARQRRQMQDDQATAQQRRGRHIATSQPTSQPSENGAATSQPSSDMLRHYASVTEVKPLPEILAISEKVDEYIDAQLQKADIKPEPPATDHVFLRRVYVDIIGRIPTYEEATAFLNSRSPMKRSELIDQLLDSEGYVSEHFNFWADVLRVQTNLERAPGLPWVLWVKQSLRENKPYDQFVSEMMTAKGYTWENGATGWYQRDFAMPLDNMANAAEVFLGTSLVCAQCHDHPFDQWTQHEFYEMAAFSIGMQTSIARGENPNLDELRILMRTKRRSNDVNGPNGLDYGRAARGILEPLSYGVSEQPRLLRLPHDYKYEDGRPGDAVFPMTIYGDVPEVGIEDSPIEVYAEWMTSPDNPNFATVIANRLWKKAFGVALIEPVNEMKDGDEASHPRVMKLLRKSMIDLDFDMKQYLRILYNTRAYQRAAVQTVRDTDAKWHYQGALLRRMSAEQIWDSFLTLAIPHVDDRRADISRALGSFERYEQYREMSPEDLMAIIDERAQQIYLNRKFGMQRGELYSQIREAEAAGNEQRAQSLRDQVEALNQQRQMMRQANQALGSAEDMVDWPDVSLELKEEYHYDDSPWKGYDRGLVRASEYPSPAPLGHFLRMFGQSDRGVIENASYDASVPQILTLLNGPFYDQMMMKDSVFVKEVNSTNSPNERIRIIFLSILTRRPLPQENAIAMREVRANGGDGYGNIVWALLNTRQFMFIE